jgi:hypothetical protein
LPRLFDEIMGSGANDNASVGNLGEDEPTSKSKVASHFEIVKNNPLY